MEVTERLILARQALYRFYAALLLYPEAERMRSIRGGAQWLAEVLDDEKLAQELQNAPQHRHLVAWAGRFDGDLQDFQAEWVRLFGSSRDGYCFPYEGAYRGAHAAGPLLAQLQKEYARAGLAMSANDLPDHVAVELEFMSYLCGLELEALCSGEKARRCRIIKAQYLFLENHLCQWLPALQERVVECEGDPFAMFCRAAKDAALVDRVRLSSALQAADTSAANENAR